jgi:hypothetical protein
VYRWIYTLRTCELILVKVQVRQAGQASDRCWNLACTTHSFTKVYRWIYTLRTCELILGKGQARKTGQASDRCWNLTCTTHNFTKVYRWIYTLRTCELILVKPQCPKAGQVSDRCWNLACTTHSFTKVCRWIYTLRPLPTREHELRSKRVIESPKSPMFSGKVKFWLSDRRTFIPPAFIRMTQSGSSPCVTKLMRIRCIAGSTPYAP